MEAVSFSSTCIASVETAVQKVRLRASSASSKAATAVAAAAVIAAWAASLARAAVAAAREAVLACRAVLKDWAVRAAVLNLMAWAGYRAAAHETAVARKAGTKMAPGIRLETALVSPFTIGKMRKAARA